MSSYTFSSRHWDDADLWPFPADGANDYGHDSAPRPACCNGHVTAKPARRPGAPASTAPDGTYWNFLGDAPCGENGPCAGAAAADAAPLEFEDLAIGDDGFGNALIGLPGGDSIALAGIAPRDVSPQEALAAIALPFEPADDAAPCPAARGPRPGPADPAAPCLPAQVHAPDGTDKTVSELENIICFTPGAMILTSHGERPIETLRIGDMVVTRDQGLRPIRWIGERNVPGQGQFAPVRVGANALDTTRNGLLVSPRHRILYTGYRAGLLFGDAEVLVCARDLVDGKDVVEEPCDQVTYIHMMFDHHEVIYADGVATESFHASDMGLNAVHEAAREELFAVFPELRSAPGHHLETVRPCLQKHEAALLVETTNKAYA